MHKTLGVLITLLIGFVCVQSFAIEARWSGVNNEVYSKYVCNGKENGARIMVVGSCTQYYECKSGESTVKTCRSPNKFFDSSSEKCVAKSDCIEPKGDCSTSKPKPTPPCNNKPTTPSTPKPTEPSKPTKPTRPTKPTKPTPTTPQDTPCEIKGQNEQQKLQEELEKQYAEFFGNSGQKCESRGGSCRGLPNGTLIPHKDNCQMYLVCFNGCGAENMCPASLLFNSETRLCDKRENSKCSL
ncbi:uncharacterized protein LOC129941230 [Eupeodes corollae]|uniref:uncharacterized protein LOC129941230 n=1 Tax=Eupeodes corollae TaxID=290404 RepID=UPI002493637A|nr:uncharacterized protein LOC129941230 [Eupeodes corollae]